MREIIAIINQKGGVGKSTTALSLGRAFILKGFKVLFVDLDAQRNLSHTMRADAAAANLTSYEVLTGSAKASEAIRNPSPGDLIAGSPSLSAADSVIVETGREYRLKKALGEIKSNYDYVIIDTPPALGILTINALTACTGVIIPAQADTYSVTGIDRFYKTISAVREYTNPDLKIMGILITRYNSRIIVSREIADSIDAKARKLGTKLYGTKIRESAAVRESQLMLTDIFDYAPASNAALDYMQIAEEIVGETQS